MSFTNDRDMDDVKKGGSNLRYFFLCVKNSAC